MSGSDAFYEVFWVLPNAPLPVAGDLVSRDDSEPIPEPVLNRRKELRRMLSAVDLTHVDQLQEAIGCCVQYVRSLRAVRAAGEPTGYATWTSAIVAQTTTIPLAFDEPMALVLQATLLLNLGTSLAHARTLECVTEAAQCFCQAAGLVQFVITLQEEICSALQTDVPVELPDLAPRILHALADMAVVMAQQLAIIKATLLQADTPCTGSVLQKLHAACYHGFDAFETAVVRCCYSARPKRDGCATLLGFATIFSRLHRALVLQLAGEAAFAASSVGKAIAFVSAAERHLQTRQSMREIGLPPLEGDGGCFQQHDHLIQHIEPKRRALQQRVVVWAKDNDTIYFEPIPSEEHVLSVEMPRALVMKAVQHCPTTRLGSVRMFREVVNTVTVADPVTTLDGEGLDEYDNVGDDDDADETDDDRATGETVAARGSEDHTVFSRPVRSDVPSTHMVSHAESREVRAMTERASAPNVSPSLNGNGIAPAKPAVVASSPAELSAPEPVVPASTTSLPPFASARRMATRIQPQKSLTTRTLLGAIGKQDSLVTLQQSEDELRKVLTDDALLRMRRTLLGGVEVYRFVRDKWKKEVLRVHDEQVVLVRKKAIALLSKQLKFPWTTVHAFQHEMQPTNQVLQLLAPPGKRMTSILVIARRGDTVEPTEFTFKTPEENALAVASLQRFLKEKRAGSATITTT